MKKVKFNLNFLQNYLETLNYYAILKKSELRKGEITLSFFSTFDQKRKNIILNVDPKNIISDSEND